MATNTYVALDKITLTSATSTVTFSNIPQTYTDLRIVISSNIASGTNNPFITFNNDFSATASNTKIIGNGSTATSTRRSNDTVVYLNTPLSNNSNPSIWTIDIFNYTSANVYKTLLWRFSDASNSVEAGVGLKQLTTAINRIDISGNSGNWAVGSTFSLYGIAAVGASPAAKATGGTIYSDDTYYYHVFGSTGTFTPLQSLTADVLVVAGGGSGGSTYGGGGGAGGVSYQTGRTISASPVTVTIGGGGASTNTTLGNRGTDSVFSTITSNGGGGGGYSNNILATTGGSGGGGGGYGFVTGAAATQGNTGGATGYGFAGGNGRTSEVVGGGGGGAGSVGAAATGNGATSAAGNGGTGFTLLSSWASITGTGVGGGYAGGGGGGSRVTDSGSSGTAVNGGSAGGRSAAALAATANTGGGGGGGGGGAAGVPPSYPSGAGGSGIVIVRYLKA